MHQLESCEAGALEIRTGLCAVGVAEVVGGV